MQLHTAQLTFSVCGAATQLTFNVCGAATHTAQLLAESVSRAKRKKS